MTDRFIVLGVDPGKKGALAAVEFDHDGHVWLNGAVDRADWPRVKALLWDMKKRAHDEGIDLCAFVEEVHSMPHQGVASMFSFGRELGLWDGLFAAKDIPVAYVAPQVWQKATISGMAGSDTKERSIRFAIAAFGDVAAEAMRPPRSRKPHDGIADAICIAWYGAAVIRRQK